MTEIISTFCDRTLGVNPTRTLITVDPTPFTTRMGHDKDREPRVSKHKRSHDKDPERKSKKRHKHDHDGEGSSHKRKRKDKVNVLDEDMDGDDMWVEKNIDMDGERVRVKIYICSLLCPFLTPSAAIGDGHSNSRELEVDLVCRRRPFRPSASTDSSLGDSTEARRLDDATTVHPEYT